jgi:hypothetical protein
MMTCVLGAMPDVLATIVSQLRINGAAPRIGQGLDLHSRQTLTFDFVWHCTSIQDAPLIHPADS